MIWTSILEALVEFWRVQGKPHGKHEQGEKLLEACEGLEVSALMEACTWHCTEADMRAMEESAERHEGDESYGIVTYYTPFGAFLLVEYDDHDPFAAEEMEREWSPGFLAVVQRARAAGCRWVKWDQDGPGIDGIPAYEW